MMLSLLPLLKVQSALLLLGTVSVTKGQQPRPQHLRFQGSRAGFNNSDNDPANVVGGKQAEKEDGDSNVSLPNRKLQTDTFSSYLQVEYQLTSGAGSLLQSGDILLSEGEGSFNNIQMMLQPVLDELILAYNGLNTEDPVQRRLDHVHIVSGVVEEVGVGLGDRGRRLQNFSSLRLTLEGVGSCNGCSRDAALTNHVTSGRRELVELTSAQRRTLGTGPRGGGGTSGQRILPKSKDSKSKDPDRGGSTPTFVTPLPPPSPPPSRAPTPRPTRAPTPAPTTPPPTPQPTTPPTPPPTVDPDPFLPTEDELLVAYSSRLAALNNALIQGVISLEEIDFVCPSSANMDDGIPVFLSRSTLTNCPALPPGFLVLDIDQDGFWCVSAPNDIVGDNLRLKPCDFDTQLNANNQAWTISSDQEGVFSIQSTKYSNVCVDVDGARLSVGTCTDDNLFTEFEFDLVQNYLKLAGEEFAGEELCVTNAGSTANDNDTVNARSCPTTSDDDDDYQWLFVFV